MRYLLPILLLVEPLIAANVYIRDGGSGAGTSWSDALDDLPASFSRSNTYYVADGTYGGHTFSTAVSGTTPIVIKKATEADHGTETGWDSAYGDGQATFGNLTFTTSYWTIDGQVGGGPDSWDSGYGFRVVGVGKLIQWTWGNLLTGLTFARVDIAYDGNAGKTYPDNSVSTGQDAIYGVGGSIDLTISYCRFYRAGRTAILSRGTWTDCTIEYTYFEECVIGPVAEHGEIWSANHFGTSLSGLVFRYNRINKFASTGGLIMSGGNNLDIYGNYFVGHSGTANGVIANWTAENTTSNVRIYNNTFVDTDATIGFGATSSWTVKNNLFVGNTRVNLNATHDYNAADVDLSEANDELLTSAIFTNYAGGDYSLASATAAGETLSATYNTDMEGVTRGSDGNWDRGAFEYVDAGGGDETAPTPDPMTFSVAPAGGEGQVTMTASTASDASTPVEYYFDETSGLSGGTDSGWQSSTSYTDTGLLADTTYTYRVKARDSAGNETAYSSGANATTDAAGGTVGTPGFSPAAGAYPGSSLEITLTAADAEYVTYSLDDEDPVIGVDPQITNGTSFTLNGNAAVRIIGHADGLTNSEVVRGFFSFTGGEPQDEPQPRNHVGPTGNQSQIGIGMGGNSLTGGYSVGP